MMNKKKCLHPLSLLGVTQYSDVSMSAPTPIAQQADVSVPPQYPPIVQQAGVSDPPHYHPLAQQANVSVPSSSPQMMQQAGVYGPSPYPQLIQPAGVSVPFQYPPMVQNANIYGFPQSPTMMQPVGFPAPEKNRWLFFRGTEGRRSRSVFLRIKVQVHGRRCRKIQQAQEISESPPAEGPTLRIRV